MRLKVQRCLLVPGSFWGGGGGGGAILGSDQRYSFAQQAVAAAVGAAKREFGRPPHPDILNLQRALELPPRPNRTRYPNTSPQPFVC
eukprot:229432-Amphidinium_carterae.1